MKAVIERYYLPAILVLCVLEMLARVLLFEIHPFANYDGVSYLIAWDELRAGALSVFRTPLYPAFIGPLFDYLPESRALAVMGSVQFGLFLLSVVAFDRLGRLMKLPSGLRIAALSVYALLPGGMYSYALRTLTDGPSASLELIWLAALFSWRRDGKRLTYILQAVLLLLLIALRPANTVCLVTLACVAVYWARIHVPVGFTGRAALTVAVAGIILGAYSLDVRAKYGNFSPSCVSYNNGLFMISHYEPYESAVAAACDAFEAVNAPHHRVDSCGNTVIHDLPYLQRIRHSVEGSDTTLTLALAMRRELENYSATHTGIWLRTRSAALRTMAFYSSDMLRIPNCIYGLFAIVALVFLIGHIRRQPESPSDIMLALWLIIAGVSFLTAISAPTDWGRLLIPAFGPMLLLGAAIARISARLIRGNGTRKSEE